MTFSIPGNIDATITVTTDNGPETVTNGSISLEEGECEYTVNAAGYIIDGGSFTVPDVNTVYISEIHLTAPTVSVAPNTVEISEGNTTTLKATASHVLKDDVKFAYQWYADGESIVGATEATYTTGTAGTFSVTVTAISEINPSWTSEASNDTAVVIVNPADVPGYPPYYPWWGDDDVYVPPSYVIEETPEDDSTTVVACAAAAVVAALMAAFLILEYRKN